MKGSAKKKEPTSYEWIGNIPTDWKIEKLKRILISPLMYGTNEAAELEDKDLPRYIRITDFNGDGILREDTFKSLPFDKAEGYYLKEGDVLFARSGATVGKSFIFNNYKGRACFAGYLIKASPNLHKLLPDFLYYYTQSSAYDIWCSSIFTQATIQNISATKYAYLPIPLPSITIQHRIASYLDKTCAAIDKAIEAKQKQLVTLEDLRKSIITKAVTRGLDKKAKRKDSGHIWIGRIPQEWKVDKLKYVTDLIVDGTHFTPDYIEEGVPFLRVTDIQNSQIDQNKVKRISEEAHRKLCKRANPKAGDILLSKNGTIGLIKIVEWNWEFSIFVSLCLIRLRKFLSPYFFRYYFESDVVDQQLFESSKRTSVTNLHLVKIREMKIAFPRLDEQQTIVTLLDNKCAELDKLKENIQQQILTLEQYRKSLIHECVTGKRRITEDDMQDQ